jgi:hemoglobin
MSDITSRADIERMMRTFYSDLFEIPHMKKVFEHINLETHLPKIVHFWSFVLLDEEGYKTNVFEKHLQLPIHSAQFDTWLDVFSKTVDRLFTGEKAELAKSRAASLAYTFKNKWQHIKGN